MSRKYECPWCGEKWQGSRAKIQICPFCGKKKEKLHQNSGSEADTWPDDMNRILRSLWQLGKPDRAVEGWRKVVSYDPNHLPSRFNLGYALWQSGQWTAGELLTDMVRLQAAHENSPEFWRCLAWIHFIQGAEDALEKIQESVYQVRETGFLKAMANPDRPVGRLHCLIQKKPRELKRQFVASPDGNHIISYASDSPVFQLWNLMEGSAVLCSTASGRGITEVVFSPDSRLIVSGNEEGLIKLWSTDGRELGLFFGHHDRITRLEFFPDCSGFISTAQDGHLRCWGVESNRRSYIVAEFEKEVNWLAISPDSRSVVAMGDRSTKRTRVAAYNLSAGELLWRFQGPDLEEYYWDFIDTCAFALNSKAVVGRSYTDDAVYIWSFENPSYPIEYNHDNYVTHMQITPKNDRIMATITSDLYNSGLSPCPSTVWIWDLKHRCLINKCPGNPDRVKAVDIDQQGEFMATGGIDGSLMLWRLADGTLVKRFLGHQGGIREVGLSPDGRFLLSSGEDWTIRLWDIESGMNLRQFPRPKPEIMEGGSIGFTPDSQYAYIKSTDVRFFKLHYPMKDWGDVNPHPLPNHG